MHPTSLLNWMLLSTALLGAWWGCYYLALRLERSFAYNRAYLVLGPLLAAGLPLLPLAWPAGWWAGPAGLPGVAAVLLPVAKIGPAALSAASASGLGWALWLRWAYGASAALVLLQLAGELGRLWWHMQALPRQVAAIRQLPAFIPGKQAGKPVSVSFTVPVQFAWDATGKAR